MPLGDVDVASVLLSQADEGVEVLGVLQFFRFEDCLKMPSANPRAARKVVSDAATYQPSTDPLTIGRFYQHPVLVEGCHRVAAF
jgi:hypothetical protein